MRHVRPLSILLVGLVAFTACGGQTTKAKRASGPDPSKNGPIVFVRYNVDESSGAIFVKNLDGSGERQVTRPVAGATDDSPEWSPDGSHIVFARIPKDGTSQVWTVAADGTDLKKLSSGPDCPPVKSSKCEENGSPSYSPDGKLIAFGYATGFEKGTDHCCLTSQIYVMDSDGRNRRAVTPFDTSGDRGEPKWSPDGKQILFRLEDDAKPDGGRALFIVNLDGTGLHQLTQWAAQAGGGADWSGPANLIVFRAVADNEAGKGNFFTIRPDGTGLTQVTHLTDTVISHRASFSPDGKWVITSHRTGATDKSDLFIMRADGSDARAFTTTPVADTAADWGPVR